MANLPKGSDAKLEGLRQQNTLYMAASCRMRYGEVQTAPRIYAGVWSATRESRIPLSWDTGLFFREKVQQAKLYIKLNNPSR